MSNSRLLNPMVATVTAVLLAAGLLALAISRETPVGALEGTVTAQESGNPIDVSVSIRPANVPNEYGRYRYAEAVDGRFAFRRVPAGEYMLEVDSHYRHSSPIKIRIEEGKTVSQDVELAPGPAKLDLYVHQHIFTPDERAQVTCEGYIESSALDVRIYKIDLNAFLTKHSGNLHGLLGVHSYYGDWHSSVSLADNPSLKLAESFRSPITKRESEGNFTQRIDLPRLGPGMYVVGVKGDEAQKLGWIMVTSLGLVTKTAGRQCLGFAVDLKTGEPVAGADVTIYEGAETVASGKTGADGLVSLTAQSKGGGENRKTIVARSGESFAFMSAYLSSSERPNQLIYAYTDRPVYRPGQNVHFRGIVRSRAGDGYAVPAGKRVTVEVRDPRDTLIYRAAKTTDSFGCYHGRIDLNAETATGTYSIVTSVGGGAPPAADENEENYEGDGGEGGRERGTTFQVAAYAKPEFTVKVTFPKKRYIRGQKIEARIKADYYFGAPVANAKVNYNVTRADYWLYEGDEEDSENEGYEDYGGYGESVTDGEVKTDENGEATVTFRADWPEPKEEYGWDNDQQFTLEAYVTDASRREANGSADVIATRGDFAVDVSPDRYVARPGTPVKVEIEAKDYDKHPVANRELTVLVGREYWTREESEFRKLEEKTVTTDSSGHATFEFSPKKAGDLRIVAVGRDRLGNRVTGSTWVWCYSEAYEEVEGTRYPDLKIITDKKSYTPGETARVLINAAKPVAAALVTVEGERIYQQFTVRLKGKSTAVDIPVRDSYKPNFYIGVCFVKNKQFANQQRRVKVSLAPQMVDIKIEPNKKRYLPGENAVYKVKATDSKGRPVNAQLSLGVVDEAIYAIRPDDTTPILDYFYSKKPNNVSTQFSFPEIYLSDPDKAGMSAKMPRQTKMRIRKRFEDTAFWRPDVTTGPRGEATVSFQMPDNLTTWRTTVRAVTLDTRCGQAVDTVLAQQDMLVRLETPRFLVQGDSTTISAIVHNYTGSQDRIDVKFDAPGLAVDGDTRTSVTVADQGSERIDWTVRAPKPGEFLLTVTAKGSKTGDAMQLPIPVYPHGEERQSVKTGAITGSPTVIVGSRPVILSAAKDLGRGREILRAAQNDGKRAAMVIPIRNDSIPEATRLDIRLAPSLAAAMLGSLDYLAQYPYGCTEQTTSSFLPDVILWQSFKDLGMRNPKLRAKLPDMVQTGLMRLYRFQLEDGGWAWCEYGKADPWMTAYVCYGLVQAKRAGFEVNSDVLRRGLERLGTVLRSNVDTETKAYACYVFALAGQDATGNLEELVRQSRLPARTLAYASLAFSQLGRSKAAKELFPRLWAAAVVEPAFVHWAGYHDYSGGDIETTALALQAALKVDPTDARVHKIVAWLMSQRQGDYWYSTRDTAMTLYAMADFLKVTKELAPDYTAVVKVNGKRVAGYHFTKGSIFEPDRVINVSPSDLRKGRNEIGITKTGQGNLYYTAKLVQWVAKKHFTATVTGAGVSIRRDYYRPGSRFYERGDSSAWGSPVDSCSSGDVIFVRLTVNSTKPLQHLLLEDFIPAGCEIVDKGHVDYWEWDYWYVGRDIRDNKISFYLDQLSSGSYVADYQMRASVPGHYCAMPAQVFGMYDPAIRATTGETEFEIR